MQEFLWSADEPLQFSRKQPCKSMALLRQAAEGSCFLQGHPYAWPAEDLLLTTITKGSCKTCGFFEDRLLPFVRVSTPGCCVATVHTPIPLRPHSCGGYQSHVSALPQKP